ncbi:CinA family protein [Actinomyces polynesiensis]|uniref:CinA family protein n=1 Tax=Actinomyces polynesiensis TaxID=1325934 RepID=UPI0005BB3674|nr:CinA family protein [Actinomyces polynesiensis]
MATDVTTLVATLIARHLTIATAESLTGGALCARLVDVPGASETVRGGVCTYATELKAQVLGVDPDRLALTGPVDREVAVEMARGVARLMGADIALSTTGVAGPGPADGHPAGTVHIACHHPGGVEHRELHLRGSRAEVRRGSVDAALGLLGEVLGTGSSRGV